MSDLKKLSDLNISNIQISSFTPNFSYDVTTKYKQSIERNLRAIQEAHEEKEAEELRRHNELIAALKEAGEKGATILIGDNANNIQIQQNSSKANQIMENCKGLDYEQAANVLKEISTYFDFPQFAQTFGDNSENIKVIVESTLEAINKREDEGIIKKSLNLLKNLAIGVGSSLIASGILAQLATIQM